MQIIFLHSVLLIGFFVAHILVLKHVLTTEMRIFLFQVALFLVLPIVSMILKGGPVSFTDFLATYGLSAGYALSFLEIWSLTEGSYSLQMLAAIDADPSGERVRQQASDIGQQKQSNRLQGIVKLGLAREENGVLHMTPNGRIVGIITGFIASTAGAGMRE